MAGFLLASGASTQAQNFQLGLYPLLSQPQAEFQRNVENLGLGIGGFFFFGPGNGYASIGADFAYILYGSEERKEPFSTTIPDVTVNVETTNNIILGHLALRLQIPVGPVRPFVDGQIGFHYLFTQTTIKNEQLEEPIATSTNFQDIAFSYGGGAGVSIKIHERKEQLGTGGDPTEKSPKYTFIEFRIRYLAGGEANYLKEGSIRREGGKVSYDTKHSRTDLMTYQVGLTFWF
jgi:hypothetical protein